MSRNVYGFYPAVQVSNYPKIGGTPVSEVEAFIAKHGLTDLDKNLQASKAQAKHPAQLSSTSTAEHRVASANQAFLSAVRAIVEEKSRNGVIKNRAFAHINNQKAVRWALSKLNYIPDSMVAPDFWRLNGYVIRDRMEDDVEFVSIREKRLAVTRVRLLDGEFVKRPKIGTELNILLAQMNQLQDEGLNIVKVTNGARRGWRLANDADIKKQMEIEALVAASRKHLTADRQMVARANSKKRAYLAWLKRRKVVLVADIPEADIAHFRALIADCRKNGFEIETLEGRGRAAIGYYLVADK